jgi:hypothetical protein
MLVIMSSSPAPPSAANKIYARLSLRAECLPPGKKPLEFVAFGLAQFHHLVN